MPSPPCVPPSPPTTRDPRAHEPPGQKPTLGLFRSDYLLHAPGNDSPLELKQVEFNTISASFGALGERAAGLHAHLLAATGYFGAAPGVLAPENLPANATTAGLAAGIARAHKAYGVPGCVRGAIVRVCGR
jgi:hypothetical protein